MTPLRGWRQAFVWLWAALILIAIFFRGEHAQIDRHVTNRLRFHAIPTAISVLYHGRPLDYTAFSSIAFQLQYPASDADFDSKIDWAVNYTPPKNDPTYFWAADDRGMADYVLSAFLLFGPRSTSLYYFYFVILTASVVLFLVDLSWNRIGSAALILALTAVYVCVSVIPLGNLTIPVFEPGSLFEPRVIELLSFVAMLHLALTPFLDSRWTPRRIGTVSAQAAILALCYHARSSVTWQIGFIVALGAACWKWRYAFDEAPADGHSMRPSTLSLLPVLCILVALVFVKGYERATYNSRYFSDLGSRTVWHNALMGLGDNKHLAGKYQLGVNDAEVVHALRKYLTEKHDPRLTTDWSDNTILGSLGGHSPFDWFTYEAAARNFYLHIWRADFLSMLRLYAIDKPSEILRVLVKATRPQASLLEDVPDLGFRPLGLVPLVLALPAFVLLATADFAFIPSIAAVLVLFGFSVIPGFLFYSVVHAMIGAFATVSLVGFVLVAGAVALVARPVRKRFGFEIAETQLVQPVSTEKPAKAEFPLWIGLAIATLLVSAYFAPRGFRGGFTDMAHDGYQLRQILDLDRGGTIFKDTFDQYGPLHGYLNLAAFRAFGRTLLSVKYAVCVWYAATAILLYWLGRRLLSPGLSALSVVAWLALAPFYRHGVMISPHAYVLFFQTAAMLAILRWADSDDLRWLGLAGICTGLCWALKTLSGTFFAAGVTVYFLSRMLDRRTTVRRGVLVTAAFYAGAAAVVAVAFGFLASRGALHDWYLQTVVFPKTFYVDELGANSNVLSSAAMFGWHFLQLNFDMVSVPVHLYWHLIRFVVICAAYVLWRRRAAPDGLVLAACVTPVLWLGAYPSANYMHQWWTASLSFPAFVYCISIALDAASARWLDGVRRYVPVITGLLLLVIFWTGIKERLYYSLERATTLTETYEEPRVLRGIRTDKQNLDAFNALYRAIHNFEEHHPSTRIVSQDHCDGYTNCVPESLLWLSFDEHNFHEHPVYWPIPSLVEKVYPEYERQFQDNLKKSKPLVVDSWDGPLRTYNRIAGYDLLVGVRTEFGYWYLFAPRDPDAKANGEIPVRVDASKPVEMAPAVEIPETESPVVQRPAATNEVAVDDSTSFGQSVRDWWQDVMLTIRDVTSKGGGGKDIPVDGKLRDDLHVTLEGNRQADGSVYTWPADLRIPPLPSPLEALKPPLTLGKGMTPKGKGWMVSGTVEGQYAYLVETRDRRINQGAYFVATGRIDRGGLTIGLLKNTKWSGLVNVDKPGPFVVVLKPEIGRYAVVIANYLDNGVTTNSAEIATVGWVSVTGGSPTRK